MLHLIICYCVLKRSINLVNVGVDDGLFSVEIHHDGFFCGLGSNRSYLECKTDWFDYCDADSWSLLLRGRGKGRGREEGDAQETSGGATRGRARGTKRNKTTRGEGTNAQGEENASTARDSDSKRGRAKVAISSVPVALPTTTGRGTGYATGPGSASYMLFGDESVNQENQEVELTQNAPSTQDDVL
jgi:hypothetical protein